MCHWPRGLVAIWDTIWNHLLAVPELVDLSQNCVGCEELFPLHLSHLLHFVVPRERGTNDPAEKGRQELANL